jgi:hypothetical protein
MQADFHATLNPICNSLHSPFGKPGFAKKSPMNVRNRCKIRARCLAVKENPNPSQESQE